MRAFTQMTINRLQFKGEKFTLPSETIPDQAISPMELLRRYAQGIPLGLKSVDPVYDTDDFEAPELFKMDKLDRLHMLQNTAEQRVELYDMFTKEQNEQREKKRLQEQDLAAEQDKSARQTTNSAAINDEK